MTFKFTYQSILVAIWGIFLLSACTKENSVTVIETEEPLNFGIELRIDGKEISSEVVAAYCQNDSIEFLVIANKEENLTFPGNTQNFAEGDFVYLTSNSATSSWGYGGHALGEDITGFPGLLIAFSDATIDIESNDGTTVIGSASGLLLGMDSQGNPSLFPYEMDFVAEIIQESDLCQ